MKSYAFSNCSQTKTTQLQVIHIPIHKDEITKDLPVLVYADHTLPIESRTCNEKTVQSFQPSFPIKKPLRVLSHKRCKPPREREK